MLVREAMKKFERARVAQGASRNTVATYKRNLDPFVRKFGDRDVEMITTSDLNDFLFSVRLKADGREKTPGTMNAIKTAVRSFFKSLPLREDPAKAIRIKRVRIERDYITEDEVRQLLAGIPVIRDKTLVAVLCLLGLRREEVAKMTVGDARGASFRIFGKGGVERDIPINATARRHLERFLEWKEDHGESVEPSAPLFVSRKGNPLSPNAIYNLVRKWTREVLGKALYPHAMRHSFASALVANSVHLATIQRLMGHSSITMTEVYLHISKELKVEAVERLAI